MRHRSWLASGGIAGAVIALVVLPACGQKTDESARAAGVLPSNALGYVSVNLEPAIEQQRNLMSVVKAFPDGDEEVGNDFGKARDDLLTGLFDEAGIDYERDVEPWLGNEVAIAVIPSSDPEAVPHPVLLVESDDVAAARKAFQRLEDDEMLPGPWDVVDEFVVVPVDGAEEALTAIKGTTGDEARTLADADAFNELVDELHGDRLLLGYIDGDRAKEAIEDLVAGSGMSLDFMRQAQLEGLTGRFAFDFHAADEALVFEGLSKAGEVAPPGPIEYELPADTVGWVVIHGIDEGLEEITADPTVDEVFGMVRDEIGLDLEQDVFSWLGGSMLAVVGAAPNDSEIPEVGVVLSAKDAEAAAAAVPRLQSLVDEYATPVIGEELGGPGEGPSIVADDDRVIVSLRRGYADVLRRVKPAADSEEGSFAFFLDGGRLAELVGEPEIGEVLEEVRAEAVRRDGFDRVGFRVEFG